ncbi:MAG: 50S ribosomal protein L24 [Phycisphaerales bacterium]|nr:50S ribosomal protein L24 [Phycisphaerales bacterium]
MARHVRKGDTVIITSGSHKGQTGTIMRIITGEPGQERVVIKGVNLRTKHMRPTRFNPQGGIVTREASIHISNVSPVVDGKPSRVRFVTKGDGSKVRVAVRGGGELGVIRGAEAKKHSGGGRAAKPAGAGKKTSSKKTVSKK